MPRKKEFMNYLFEICHSDVRTKDLLTSIRIDFKDALNTKKRNYISIVDKGATLIGKFFFIKDHLDRYIHRVYHLDDEPWYDYYHINDQIGESKMELIHSVLLARTGLCFDAVNILRRSFEVAIFGSFFAITSIEMNEMKYNPFALLVDRNLYFESKSMASVRFNDLKKFIAEVSEQESISEIDAESKILNNFTYYFLRLCRPTCKDHYDNKTQAVCSLEPGNNLQCKSSNCFNNTNEVVVDKIVTTNLMMRVIESKLQSKDNPFINLIDLYRTLSRYVHPNYVYHQHAPIFDNKSLKEWLKLLKITVNTLVWLYVKTVVYIGYRENNIEILLNSKEYNLSKIPISELNKRICNKLENPDFTREQRTRLHRGSN